MAYYFGALAQLGERLICIQEVSGSIPLGSTKIFGDWLSGHYLITVYIDLIVKYFLVFNRPIGRMP